MKNVNVYIRGHGKQIRSFLPAGKDDEPIAILAAPPGSDVDFQGDRLDTPRAKQLSADGAIVAARSRMFGLTIVQYDPHKIRSGGTNPPTSAPFEPTTPTPTPTPRRRPRKEA